MDDAELWRQWLTDRMAEAGIDANEFIARSDGQFSKFMAHQWLHGHSRPSPEMALQVAEILGVPESEAFGASGHLKLAGTVSKLTTAATGSGIPLDKAVQQIRGFELLTETERAEFAEIYRQDIEAAQRRVQAMVDEALKRREDPAD